MQCPKCTHEIDESYFPLGLVHCPYCGEKVGVEDPYEHLPFCSGCGERLLTEVSYCPRCGKRVGPALKTARREVEPSPVYQEVETTETPRESEQALPVEPAAEEASPPACYRQPRELPPPREPVWNKFKRYFKRVARPVAENISNEGRLEKLYQGWSTEAGLPPEEIPSAAELKSLASQNQSGKQPPPLRLQAVILMAIGILAVFIAFGILLWTTNH
jgi:endogenous inhibitor of DNA gyrase (YacG/DUF329 family)